MNGPAIPCPACGGSGDRNGNLRASDPFGTCPGCDGRGIGPADGAWWGAADFVARRFGGTRATNEPKDGDDA